MWRGKTMWGLLAAGVLTALVGGAAFAQDAAAGGGGGAGGNRGGGRGGRGNFDPAAMRQRMLDHVKETLAVGDDEWKVLQPRIEKVMTLERQMRTGGMMMFGGRGGRRGGGDNAAAAPASDVEQKAEDLKTLLDNKDSKPQEIATKLAALRAAREKVKQDLVKAQTELKEIVTPRQEALLVMSGLLD